MSTWRLHCMSELNISPSLLQALLQGIFLNLSSAVIDFNPLRELFLDYMFSLISVTKRSMAVLYKFSGKISLNGYRQL